MSSKQQKNQPIESLAVKKAKQALSVFVAEHQLSFQGMFIPQKFSNNAKEDRLTLNWRGVISSKHGNMDTNYSKGIGHLDFERLSVVWHTPEKTRGNRRYEHAIQIEQKAAANGGKPCHVFIRKDGEVVRSEVHPKREKGKKMNAMTRMTRAAMEQVKNPLPHLATHEWKKLSITGVGIGVGVFAIGMVDGMSLGVAAGGVAFTGTITAAVVAAMAAANGAYAGLKQDQWMVKRLEENDAAKKEQEDLKMRAKRTLVLG